MPAQSRLFVAAHHPPLPPTPWTRVQAAKAIKLLERSGLPVARFAKEYKIKPFHFYEWRKRLRSKQENRDIEPSFARVRITERSKPVKMPKEPVRDPQFLELVSPRGWSIRLHGMVDQQQLALAIAVLEATSC